MVITGPLPGIAGDPLRLWKCAIQKVLTRDLSLSVRLMERPSGEGELSQLTTDPGGVESRFSNSTQRRPLQEETVSFSQKQEFRLLS
jgi:hypothetical protein